MSNLKVGYAITGSFCTIKKVLPHIRELISQGWEVYPILSEITASSDTRFIGYEELIMTLESITEKKVISSIKEAEPIGPEKMLDALVIMPCTGNTLAKLALSITDSAVTMAAKAQLRNGGPVVLGISTNDGLAGNFKNIGLLMNAKNVFFVPFKQDAPFDKTNSLVAEFDLVVPTLKAAMDNKQYQPVLV